MDLIILWDKSELEKAKFYGGMFKLRRNGS